jgi:predicted MFS family arabinose efflux permease
MTHGVRRSRASIAPGSGTAPGGGGERPSTSAVLRLPGVPPMALWSFVGRFGYAMLNVALLLFVQAEYGSYAVAGVISAASLAGTAAGNVVQGRLIDRLGLSRPLLVAAALQAPLAAAVVVAPAMPVPVPLLGALVVVQSATLPMLPVASRATWSRLLPAGAWREAGYGYEAVSSEVCWLLGPATAALLATALWPGTALVVTLALVVSAACGFASMRAVRTAGRGTDGGLAPAPVDGHRQSEPSHVGIRGLVMLLAAAAGFGFGVGAVVIGVTAGTAAAGRPAAAGVLLALWSVTSVLAGLVHQRRPWPEDVAARLVVWLAAFGVALALPGAHAGLAVLTLSVVLSGATLVPQLATHNTFLDGLVPGRRLAEAYGWVTTVVVGANAAGQALGGIAVERVGPGAAFALGAAVALALALTVLVLRPRSEQPRATRRRHRRSGRRGTARH